MIRFSKMHGLGNDFMVIDAINQNIDLCKKKIQHLANRHTGVGFDQLLLVEAADRHGVDFRYRIFNADGGEVEQCGNGARCFARFVHQQQLTDKAKLRVSTKCAILELHYQNNDHISVNMGKPIFTPSEIPLSIVDQNEPYHLKIDDQEITFYAVSMGNPHVVIFVDDIDSTPVATIGAALNQHSVFPKQVNVGFVQVCNAQHIKLRVYERGVGETQACGSGACAAVVAAHRANLIGHQAKVQLTGGDLNIDWQSPDGDVIMTGVASHVYDGEIDLDRLV